MSEPLIVGAGRSQYSLRSGGGEETPELLRSAAQAALADAGLELGEIDGFGVCSFTLGPDNAIDLAWRLGLRLRWLTQDTTGGCCGVNMLQHGIRAIESGDVENILLVAGDRMLSNDFRQLADGYNKATRDHLAPLPFDGPNTLFSFLTQRHMERHGLSRESYGAVATSQRGWASRNPAAVYRKPLSMEEYLGAPVVAPPLGRFDCPRPVSGADAIVISSGRRNGKPGCRVRSIGASMNRDDQEGDGLQTGLADVAPGLWERAGARPEDADVVAIYDDYPVMVLIQATDLGLAPGGEPAALVERIADGMPLNTSGGLLSAGQAGAGAGLHGLVEVTQQLRGECEERQVEGAELGLVAGYGMVLYRYGACSNAAILERVG